jgi:hypothetical protein
MIVDYLRSPDLRTESTKTHISLTPQHVTRRCSMQPLIRAHRLEWNPLSAAKQPQALHCEIRLNTRPWRLGAVRSISEFLRRVPG